jgi:hypothetical protein
VPAFDPFTALTQDPATGPLWDLVPVALPPCVLDFLIVCPNQQCRRVFMELLSNALIAVAQDPDEAALLLVGAVSITPHTRSCARTGSPPPPAATPVCAHVLARHGHASSPLQCASPQSVLGVSGVLQADTEVCRAASVRDSRMQSTKRHLRECQDAAEAARLALMTAKSEMKAVSMAAARAVDALEVGCCATG